MARRYPDDDPLRHMSSHSVALTVGLCVQRHHQHEIPAETKQSGLDMETTCHRFEQNVDFFSFYMSCPSPLVWIWFALLPHVIRCGLAEVEPPHCDFRYLLWWQRDTGGDKNPNHIMKF